MEAVSSSMGVMAPLLTKLAVLLRDKCNQLKGVRKDIEFLSRELTEMNVVLEKLADMEELDGQQKLWRNDVCEMAYDIEDCIDVFMYHLGDGNNKDGLLKKTARKLRSLRARYQIANKIEELKARVKQAAERRNRYIGLGKCTSSPKLVEVDPRLPALYEAAENLVGIDGQQDEIVRWLMDGESGQSRQLKVISIVGFGGLGKTTLAKQVYNKINEKFECKSFVSVSKNPDMLKLLKSLLSEIGCKDYGIDDDHQSFIDALRRHLSCERYLIVIDDIWSIKSWSILKCAFVQNNCGSRVIITTRIEDVAECCLDFDGIVYKMQPLDEVNSERLFCKRIFGSENGIPEQYKTISEAMLRKCRGVPLAIISIASLLASKGMHPEKWEKIQNHLGSELETNRMLEWMRHVLLLSYNDLSHSLRTCFLYLGIYPEDNIILKADLIRLWIAEGFIDEKPGFDLEEVAESYFNELINRSMIQPDGMVKQDDFLLSDEVISCRVHDLMLDLIILKCQEDNFITIASKSIMNGTEVSVRRICHQLPYRNLAMESMKLSQRRSLITFPNFFYTAQLPISKFEHLRVLNLMADNPFPLLDLSGICNLFLLRYLSIKGFRLKLPRKIGSLQRLRELDLVCSSLVTSIPSDIISLSSLCHLTVSSNDELPSGIGELVSLQTLSIFHVSRWIYSPKNVRVEASEVFKRRLLAKGCSSSSSSKKISFWKKIRIQLYFQRAVNYFIDLLRRYVDIPSASILNLSSSILAHQLPDYLECPINSLQRLVIRKSIHGVPGWMIWARKLTMLELRVKELQSVQVLVWLPSLTDLDLTAEATPENILIIYTNTFRNLQRFILTCALAHLKFEPEGMPELQILKLDSRWPAQLEEMCSSDGDGGAVKHSCSSPLIGIEHLAKLEEIQVTSHSSKVSAYRDAVQRHPRIQDIRARFNTHDDGSTRTPK